MHQLMRNNYAGYLSKSDVGKTVILNGWVQSLRDHGGLIFIDLRDKSGFAQIIFDPKINIDCHKIAETLRNEYLIAIKGIVKLRSKGMINLKILSGEIEIKVNEIELLNTSLPLPFLLNDGKKIHEDLRLEYRFLDLRQNKLQKNLIRRHNVIQSIHNFLNSEDFIEIDTPILNKSTPEGARDFLVPSRIYKGNFYSLPQSPQIFKQILMVSGFEKYYQIAKCFRDEDLRSDRQPEFTQLDIEMSFINKDYIMEIIEKMFIRILQENYKIDVKIPFSKISYDEAMSKYGTDKPDLRFDLAISNVSDIVKESDFKIFQHILKENGEVASINVKNAKTLSNKDINDLTQFLNPFGAKGLAWMRVKENHLESNIVKYFNNFVQKKLIDRLKAENGDLLLFLAGEPCVIYPSLGKLRLKLSKMLNLIKTNELIFTWVFDFPLFEYNREENRYKSLHHPFTLPKLDQIKLLDTNPLKIYSESYDLILNGIELGGGGLRINKRKLQEKIFNFLGLSKNEYEKQFGFLLKSLEYGAPPHGGIAFGLDRLLMILQKENSIRDVIAFPKTQKGSCLMSQTPSEITDRQMMDINIKVDKL